MNDRKYRQRGYQDDSRPERTRAPQESQPRELRKPNFPGFAETVKCGRCGQRIGASVQPTDTCEGCGSDLRTCAQCTWFESAKRFECAKPIPARIAPKDVRNSCDLFQVRVTIERKTGSTSAPSARDAFDDLFK